MKASVKALGALRFLLRWMRRWESICRCRILAFGSHLQRPRHCSPRSLWMRFSKACSAFCCCDLPRKCKRISHVSLKSLSFQTMNTFNQNDLNLPRSLQNACCPILKPERDSTCASGGLPGASRCRSPRKRCALAPTSLPDSTQPSVKELLQLIPFIFHLPGFLILPEPRKLSSYCLLPGLPSLAKASCFLLNSSSSLEHFTRAGCWPAIN